MSDRPNRRELLRNLAGLGLAGGVTSLANAGGRTAGRSDMPPEPQKVSPEILAFYARPERMTALGSYAPRFEDLPRELPALNRAVQGLLLHHHWAPAYGVKLSDERASEAQIRPVEEMLKRLLAPDDGPLGAQRPA